MSHTKRKTITTWALFGTLTLATTGIAQATTNKEFLKFSPESQADFFDSTVVIAAAIMTQIKRPHAECIVKWYPDDEATRDKRRREMLSLMSKFPDKIPIGAVIFSVQKACGKFKDAL